MVAVAILAIISKTGVWLYREWPRPYMEYIRIDGPGPGRVKDQIFWFDTRRAKEAAALAKLKAQLEAEPISWSWGKES